MRKPKTTATEPEPEPEAAGGAKYACTDAASARRYMSTAYEWGWSILPSGPPVPVRPHVFRSFILSVHGAPVAETTAAAETNPLWTWPELLEALEDAALEQIMRKLGLMAPASETSELAHDAARMGTAGQPASTSALAAQAPPLTPVASSPRPVEIPPPSSRNALEDETEAPAPGASVGGVPVPLAPRRGAGHGAGSQRKSGRVPWPEPEQEEDTYIGLKRCERMWFKLKDACRAGGRDPETFDLKSYVEETCRAWDVPHGNPWWITWKGKVYDEITEAMVDGLTRGEN